MKLFSLSSNKSSSYVIKPQSSSGEVLAWWNSMYCGLPLLTCNFKELMPNLSTNAYIFILGQLGKRTHAGLRRNEVERQRDSHGWIWLCIFWFGSLFAIHSLQLVSKKRKPERPCKECGQRMSLNRMNSQWQDEFSRLDTSVLVGRGL